MKISVCIPTYNRIDVLKQAIQSCLTQTRLPHEILIGDDSPNDETEKWVKTISIDAPMEIKYFHNHPSLRQVHNVNNLFNHVQGELSVLLHDDDTLLSDALESLYDCFIKHPEIDAAFGKQYLMTYNGVVDMQASEGLNQDYFRTSNFEGIKLSALESGLLQQFPNDCYMIKSEVAKKIQYNENAKDACDFDFGLRLGINNCKMYFLNKYTANYRSSIEGVSNNKDFNGDIISYQLIEKIDVPVESSKYKTLCLANKASAAIVEAAKLKNYGKAFNIYFSKYHRKRILTLGGFKRLIWIIILYFSSNK